MGRTGVSEDRWLLGETNLATFWGLTMGGQGRARIWDDTVMMAVTGTAEPYFNPVVVQRAAADPARLLEHVVDVYGDVPPLLWLRQKVDPSLATAAKTHGWDVLSGPIHMVLDPIPPAPAPPPELALRALDSSLLRDYDHVISSAFGWPEMMSASFRGPDLLASEQAHVVVGYVEDTPVAAATLVVTGDIAGVYNVGTVYAWRGRGYGEAVTWAVIEEGRRRGCTRSVVQASALAVPVSANMGYRETGRYLFLTPPRTFAQTA
jgi:GNAT superfamily N-acetyltransferase